MKHLTIQNLKAAHACSVETARFAELFGEGNEVTHERVMSVAQKFDWMFAATHLLTKRQYMYFRVLILNASRGLRRLNDPDQSKRRKALANAFYLAYNSRED